jgi:glycosyltransferase involved in cell wall biosynthesis
MKIAFLTPEYPHSKMKLSGGIGTSVLNLSNGLLLSGNQIFVVLYGQNKDDFFIEKGIAFYLIKNVKCKGLSKYLTQKKIEKCLNKLIDEDNVDLIEAVDWEGITSNITTKCPIVVKLHGSDTYFCHLDNRPVKFLNRFHEKRALKKADAVISVSQYTADLTNQLFGLNRNFKIIPNGIDLLKFQYTIDSLEENDLKILYFGTLIRKKGSLELPLIFNEVFKKNKNAKLILVGKDSSDIKSGNTSVWSMMKEMFTEEALQNVNYMGSVPYDSIKEHIKAATVCVFPTFAEALPVSWIEAMAMNKAVVASNIGWSNEIIDDGINGFLVHPKDHATFAQRIVELLDNRELNTTFGVAARVKAMKSFSNEVIAAKNLAYYEYVIQTYKKSNRD